LIVSCLAAATRFLANVRVSTPFSSLACELSSSRSSGSVIAREKLDYARSR
jgi:hypothetical protein